MRKCFYSPFLPQMDLPRQEHYVHWGKMFAEVYRSICAVPLEVWLCPHPPTNKLVAVCSRVSQSETDSRLLLVSREGRRMGGPQPIYRRPWRERQVNGSGTVHSFFWPTTFSLFKRNFLIHISYCQIWI